MSELRKANSDELYFLTFTVVGWIDIFTRCEYCEIITENLNFCIQHKNIEVFKYVIMPSHLHLIVRGESDKDVSNFIRDFKSYTAKTIISNIETSLEESRKEWLLYMFRYFAKGSKQNSNYQFWQKTNHPTLLFTNSFIDQKVDYIHENPVNSGIVTQAEFYKFSSANPDSMVKISEL